MMLRSARARPASRALSAATPFQYSTSSGARRQARTSMSRRQSRKTAAARSRYLNKGVNLFSKSRIFVNIGVLLCGPVRSDPVCPETQGPQERQEGNDLKLGETGGVKD